MQTTGIPKPWKGYGFTSSQKSVYLVDRGKVAETRSCLRACDDSFFKTWIVFSFTFCPRGKNMKQLWQSTECLNELKVIKRTRLRFSYKLPSSQRAPQCSMSSCWSFNSHLQLKNMEGKKWLGVKQKSMMQQQNSSVNEANAFELLYLKIRYYKKNENQENETGLCSGMKCVPAAVKICSGNCNFTRK